MVFYSTHSTCTLFSQVRNNKHLSKSLTTFSIPLPTQPCFPVQLNVNSHNQNGKHLNLIYALFKLGQDAWILASFFFFFLHFYGQKITPNNFVFVGKKEGNPMRTRSRPILPTWVANQNTGFTLSCPLTEPAI